MLRYLFVTSEMKMQALPERADAVSAVGTARQKSTVLGLKPSCERKPALSPEWVRWLFALASMMCLLKCHSKEFIYFFHILRRLRFIGLAVFGTIDFPERISRVG
jgi:hypothetical protein